MAQELTATFAKLRSGEWGICTPRHMTPGTKIVVKKRSGEKQTVIVGEFVEQTYYGVLNKIGTEAVQTETASDMMTEKQKRKLLNMADNIASTGGSFCRDPNAVIKKLWNAGNSSSTTKAEASALISENSIFVGGDF